MRKLIEVDGKKIPFEANGATPRLYRNLFHRDFLLDMDTLAKEASSGKQYGIETLEIFENIAFVMAKRGDPDNVPDTADEWLENFEMFSIYTVMPQLIQLWQISASPTVELKKKIRNNG